MAMFLVPLGAVSLLASLALFAYTQTQDGGDTAVTVSGQVFTGSVLFAIAVVLAIAGALFIVAGLMRAVRRVVGLIATVVLLSGGGIATLVPDSVTSYVKQNCPERLRSVPAGAAVAGCSGQE